MTNIFTGILLICYAAFACAESGNVSLQVPINSKFSDTGTLTDAKLRADDGSLSVYSLKSKLIYRGPTLGDFSAPDQPNPDGSVGNYAQALKGQLMGRYRLSSTQAISVGGGVILNHPFHGMDRTDAKDPFATYDMAAKINGIEMRNSPGVIWTTTPELTKTGQVGAITYTNSMVKKLGMSRAGAGVETILSWWLYGRNYKGEPAKKGGDGHAQEYSLAVTPSFSYNFSEYVLAYSAVGFTWYNARANENKTGLDNQLAYWRIGAAYTLGRDIYISPYLDTYPGQLSPGSTTFNFQTIFSVL